MSNPITDHTPGSGGVDFGALAASLEDMAEWLSFNCPHNYVPSLRRAADVLTALSAEPAARARAARLEAALRPFCFGDPTLDQILFGDMPDSATCNLTVRLRDTRAARAALNDDAALAAHPTGPGEAEPVAWAMELADSFERSGKGLFYPEQFPEGYPAGWDAAHRECAKDLRHAAKYLSKAAPTPPAGNAGAEPAGEILQCDLADDAAAIDKLTELNKAATPGAWYVVDTPWGNGDWISAGNPDPHAGKAVCNFDFLDEDREEGGPTPQDDAAFVAALVTVYRSGLLTRASFAEHYLERTLDLAKEVRELKARLTPAEPAASPAGGEDLDLRKAIVTALEQGVCGPCQRDCEGDGMGTTPCDEHCDNRRCRWDPPTQDDQVRRLLALLPAASRPDEQGEPVAWLYELKRELYSDSSYGGWCAPIASISIPRVPAGSIRNIRPLYAHPAPAASRPGEPEGGR